MKKITFTLLCFFCFLSSRAQDNKPSPPSTIPIASSDYHMHKGFHFQFGIGPAFGTIDDNAIVTDSGIAYPVKLEFGGTGIVIDMKIGGAVQENLILTFDIISKAIVGPSVSINGQNGTATNDYSIGEVTYGAGLTYYLMPSDIFFAGTFGAGAFVSNNTEENLTSRSEYGFSFQLKAGKHWWISSKWGISLCAAYGSTSATDSGSDSSGPYTDNFSSNRFMITASIGVH